MIFFAHGAQKLFVFGFAGVPGTVGQLGAPLPEITGPATAFVEFFSGLALIAGLLGATIALAINGAGRFSLDTLTASRTAATTSAAVATPRPASKAA